MKFYESNLFWKTMVPFAVLCLMSMGLASQLLGRESANTAQWILAGFALVASVQVWMTYQAVVGRHVHNLEKALNAAVEKGNTQALERLVKSKGQNGEFEKIISYVGNYTENLRGRVDTMMTHVRGMISTGEELNKLIVHASRSTEKQLQQTDMVATAVTEMSNSVKTVAENAQAASDRSVDAVSSSNNGQRVIAETVSAIDRVSTEMNNAKSVIQSLNKDSENIGAVLDVIKGIAEQTNLLALNAAIEAARAGEQGRGFAVVADEVRTLASKTQESTREIEAMIERLQAGAGEAVGVIEQGVASTASTVQQAEQARKAISDIVEAVKVAKQMSEHISHAAREQKGVTEDMNRNILTIAEASKESAHYTHQIAETASQLQNLAREFNVLAVGLGR